MNDLRYQARPTAVERRPKPRHRQPLGALAGDHPGGVVDGTDGLEVGDDVGELVDVADLQDETVSDDSVGQRLHGPPDDVGTRVGKGGGAVFGQVVAIEGFAL